MQLTKNPLVTPVKRQRVGKGKQKRTIDPIERDFALVCPIEVRLRGHVAGGYLLQKGQRLRFIWRFDCRGFATYHERFDETVEQLQMGLRDLPQREAFTVRAGSFATDRDRQAELAARESRTPIGFLVRSLRSRTQRLRKAGRFNPKYLHIDGEYTLEESHDRAKDGIERAIHSVHQVWQTYAGEREKAARIDLEAALRSAYNEGFLSHLEFLRSKLGLTVEPRTAAEIHQFEWRRVNDTPAPSGPPQCLVLDRNGLHWQEGEGLHTLTALFPEGTPKGDRRWVYIAGKKRFCGGVVFAKSPGGWRDRRDQLLSGAAILNRPETRDTEIVVQLRPDNQRQALDDAERRTKGTNSARREANTKAKIDVGASRSTEENVEIENMFYDGEVLVRYGWMAIAYRSTTAELDEALNRIAAIYRQPARLEREEEYFPNLWVQAQPWSWQLLLKEPYERRLKLFTKHLPGMLPLSVDRTPDRQGICLIGKQGNTPLYVNPFGKRPQHSAILGATGSGKSVFAGGLLSYALASGFDVTIIDSTRGDGSGTFDAFTDFVDGAYFNTVTQSNNIFETGDLRAIADEEEREAKETMYRKLLQSGLLMLTTDKDTPAHKVRTYRNLLSLGLKTFFERAEIQRRYATAYDGGFGSRQWQDMPTLRDFEAHITPEQLGLVAADITGEIETALKAIHLELRSVLSGPLGKCIAQPSTFDTRSRLVVYALGGANEEQDIAPLVLSAYSHALRRSFTTPRTFLFLDEASELIGNYPAIAEIIAAVWSKARKSGISACYSGQDIESIARADCAPQIFNNTTNYFIGSIKSTAIKTMVERLEIPRPLLQQNALDSFPLPLHECATPWLAKVDSLLAQGDYYPGKEELALLVNEPEFVAQRNAIFAQYPGDRYRALAETAQLLTCRI